MERVCVQRVPPSFSTENLEWASLVVALLEGRDVSHRDRMRITNDLLSMGMTLQHFKYLPENEIALTRALYLIAAEKNKKWYQFDWEKSKDQLICGLIFGIVVVLAYLLAVHPDILGVGVLLALVVLLCVFLRRWIVLFLGRLLRAPLRAIRLVRRFVRKIEEETRP